MRVVERAGDGLRVTRMAVPLRDTEEENLLDHLEPCLGFIDEGRKVGNVLVHCFAGVSRSASIIVAYLMRSEQKSLEEALESLKEISELACPNDGFLDQVNPTNLVRKLAVICLKMTLAFLHYLTLVKILQR
ncbi:unnamed protein product [Urochloa humidicola]